MTTKKTSNRPVFAASKSASESDNKALGARFAAFATLKEAGVTVDSIKGNGADYADFKEGILLGWQGAAFAAKFLSTSDGKAILTGRKIVGQNAFEPVTKSKENWATDVSGRVSKFRGYYAEWIKPAVAADPAASDAVTDPAAPAAAPTAPPAAKRKSGAKKSLSVRILDDVAAMSAAVQRDLDAGEKAQLHSEMARDLLAAFVKVTALATDGKIKS